MINQFLQSRKILLVLLFAVLTQGCVRASFRIPSGPPTAQDIQAIATENIKPSPTSTKQVTKTPVPTATEILPTETLLPKVTISAVNGNLYIRRGPGMPYNQIGVLHKGSSADVIARDVLSRWVQVVLPDSGATGWVSIQTEYSKLNGDYDSLPDFTFKEWPVPAYLDNCSEHDMFIEPDGILLTSYFTYPDNEVQLNPGTYSIYDATMPDLPFVTTIDIREGSEEAIIYDGTGTGHKCP